MKKEVLCQQVLQPDGTVFSVQSLDLPKAMATAVDARSVMDRYFAFIRSHTLGFVRPTTTAAGGVEFRLLSFRLSLLSFSPPRYQCNRNGTAASLDLSGGVLMQGPCASGVFSLVTEEVGENIRVTVQLDRFRPALMGCDTPPTAPRRFLYRLTQASVHKRATIAFLMRFYREFSGVKARSEVKEVRLREGTNI